MSVAAALARLRAGTEKAGAGRFRVDSKRALAKLRDFRLADPYQYALELLRSAAASGAARVDVTSDRDELTLRFDGRPFPAEPLRELFGCALTSGADADSQRLRLLAYGVLGALALRPRFVLVESGGVAMRFSPPDRAEPVEGAREGTRISVRKRMGWELLKRAVLGRREERLMGERTTLYEPELWLNGARVEAPPLGDPAYGVLEKKDGPRRLRLGVVEGPAQATVELAVYGVGFAHRLLPSSALPVVAAANDDHLRRSASGSDAVDGDPVLAALMAKVAAAADDRLDELVAELRQAHSGPLRRLLLRAAFSARDRKEMSARAQTALENAPLLPGPSGEWVSQAELLAEVKKGRPIRTASERYTRDLYDAPVVLVSLSSRDLGDLTEAQLEQELLPEGPRKDIRDEVENRRRRNRNRFFWKGLPEEKPQLPPSPSLARGPITKTGFDGEVALTLAEDGAQVRFLHKRRLLAKKFVVEALRPLNLVAVVDSDELSADEDWLSVREDAGYLKAVEAIRDTYERLVIEALADSQEPEPALRAHGRGLIGAMFAQRRDLPSALKDAPLYALIAGGWTTLAAFERGEVCRFSPLPRPHPALDGQPVAVLSEGDLQVIRKILGKRPLRDFSQELRREMDVRKRLAGPRELARLAGVIVKRAVVGEGLAGEVGLRYNVGNAQLRVAVLREGFRLATESHPSRYGPVVAIVDCPGLTPNAGYDGAVDDAVHARVIEAVRTAERALAQSLVELHPGTLWDALPIQGRSFLDEFLRREIDAAALSDPDPVVKAVIEAPLFETSHGTVTLRELAAEAKANGRLFSVGPGESLPDASAPLRVLRCEAATAKALADALRVETELPWAELERLERRLSFLQQPERAPQLPPNVAFTTRLRNGPFEGSVGAIAVAEGAPSAHVELLLEGRPLITLSLPSRLGLRAVFELDDATLDPPLVELPEAHAERLKGVLSGAEVAIARSARAAPDAPLSREVVLRALGARLDAEVAELRTEAVYPTLSGKAVSAAQLQSRKRVRYALEAIPTEAVTPDDASIVLAADPLVLAGLARFGGQRRDVTAELRERMAAREAHAARPAVQEIRLTGSVLFRRPFTAERARGELGVVAEEGGFVELFRENRLVGREPLAVPRGIAAAVNSDQLTLKRDFSGVRRDHGLRSVIESALREAEALAGELAARHDTLDEPQQGALVRLSAWLLERGRAEHPALAAPVLEGSDGRPLSFRDLRECHAREGHVLVSEAAGSLLARERWVWRPRAGEREALPAKTLELVDATEALARAASLRKQPPLTSLSPPVRGRWRERVLAPGIEGELVLPEPPNRSLEIELCRGRRPLERFSTEHPLGGTARVNSDALQADALWTMAARDAAFQAVRAAVEAAHERCVARLLTEGQERDWRPFALPLLRSFLGGSGPVAEALPRLPLLQDLAGRALSVGQVLAESSRRGRVAFVPAEMAEHAPALDRLVLSLGPEDREIVAALGITLEDLSAEAAFEVETRERREKNRLSSLSFGGGALLRLPIDRDGWRGELALTHPIDEHAEIVLAKDGIAIDRHREGPLGVAGVLEHAQLAVDRAWTRAELTEAQRARLHGFVEELFAHLANAAAGLAPGLRGSASLAALRFLARRGIDAPAHLDRLESLGVPDSLARASLFPLADGRAASLRALSDSVLRYGPVAVLPEGLVGESGGVPVLLALDAKAPWLEELQSLLGRDALERLASAAEWRKRQAERDPEPDDPLARGLRLLRQEAEGLHAGAAGRLGRGELADVRLLRGDGREPVLYDAARAVALVDANHAGVRSALERAEAAPDAILVLVAALYGAVNRALEQVTDADEARLVAALLERLARAEPAPAQPAVESGSS